MKTNTKEIDKWNTFIATIIMDTNEYSKFTDPEWIVHQLSDDWNYYNILRMGRYNAGKLGADKAEQLSDAWRNSNDNIKSIRKNFSLDKVNKLNKWLKFRADVYKYIVENNNNSFSLTSPNKTYSYNKRVYHYGPVGYVSW